jgi:hypothetical protein
MHRSDCRLMANLFARRGSTQVKHKVAALFLALGCTPPLAGQEPIPPASSFMPPGYLQAMPPVDRVLSDMKVADSVETRARQYVAVSDLGHILFVLTWDHGVVLTSDNHTRSGLTPEETRLERGYRDASNRLLFGSGGAPGLDALINRYSAARSPFHKELLDRYFSPPWKAAFLAVEGQLKALAAASKRQPDSTARANSIAREEEARPFRPAPVPPDERRFAMALNDWCRAKRPTPENPLAREQADREVSRRFRAIVSAVGPISDWSGILLKISAKGSDAGVTMSVDTVSSYRGAAQDALYAEVAQVTGWFKERSPAYAAASRMQVGQRLFFSGRALEAGSEQFRLLASEDNPEQGCGIRFAMELTALRPAP